jgi:hypothetical protein
VSSGGVRIASKCSSLLFQVTLGGIYFANVKRLVIVCHYTLFVSFRPRCDPGVDSAFNRKEYQRYLLGGKCSRCVRLIVLPPSCADCLEILGISTSWNPKGLSRPVKGELFTKGSSVLQFVNTLRADRMHVSYVL